MPIASPRAKRRRRASTGCTPRCSTSPAIRAGAGSPRATANRPGYGAKIAAAQIGGLQGDRLDADDSVAACAKHLGANSAVEGGRDYSAVELSERAMRESYLPPFRAAAASGVACFMAAFNTYAGVPGVANAGLLNDMLRQEWGFSGIVVSDFGSIDELMVHGVVGDGSEAATRALLAGTDIDMQSGAYRRELPGLVRSGRVPEAALDRSVRRVLALKEALGLFRDPYARMDPQREAATLLAPAHRAAAQALAEKSLVLVKNERSTLPFRSDVRRIAVIGPRADARADMMGPWSADGHPADAVTLADGLRELLPQAEVVIDAAGSTGEAAAADIAEAVAAAKAADVVVLALGEKAVQSGEAASRADPSLPVDQLALAQAVLAAGRPTAVVLFHGRPLVLGPLVDQADALLLAWFPGTMGGAAIARTLFGANEPRGRLPISWPRSVGQIPVYHDHLPTGRPATEPPRPLHHRLSGPVGQPAVSVRVRAELHRLHLRAAPARPRYPARGGEGRGVGRGHQHRSASRHRTGGTLRAPAGGRDLPPRARVSWLPGPGARAWRHRNGQDRARRRRTRLLAPRRRPQGRSRPLRHPDRTGCRLVAVRESGAPAIARRLAVIGCRRR